jgi:hypothetical protein
MVYSKPKVGARVQWLSLAERAQDVRPAFQLQLRYNFHNPPLGPRDYTAIEHQVRICHWQDASSRVPRTSARIEADLGSYDGWTELWR